MKRTRHILKTNEEVFLGEGKSFTVEKIQNEVNQYRLIEWFINYKGQKRIEDIWECTADYIQNQVDKNYGLLIKIMD